MARSGWKRAFWIWFWAHPVVVALFGLFCLVMLGRQDAYFSSARQMQATLDALEQAVVTGDREALTALFHEDFTGVPITAADDWRPHRVDRVAEASFQPMGAAVGRDEAVDAWLRYGADFEQARLTLTAWRYAEREGRRSARFHTLLEMHGASRSQGAPRLDDGVFELRFVRAGDQYLIAGQSFPEPLHSQLQPAAPAMVDVALERGLDWVTVPGAIGVGQVGKELIPFGGGGVGGGDFDQDGDIDLIFAGASVALYEALEGGFYRQRPLGFDAPDLVNASGIAVMDYDNDGWLDIMLSHQKGERASQLYRAEGPFSWSNVTEASGIDIPVGSFNLFTTWGDYDGDGDLDCYALNFGEPTLEVPEFILNARNGHKNLLFRNDGDGSFTDVTDEAGVGDTGWALAGQFFDYDEDGFTDLYVVNDYGGNRLYRSQGDGTFENVTWSSGAYDYGSGMGVSSGDIDNDGDIDMYVSNVSAEELYFYETPLLGWKSWRMMLDSDIRGAVFRARDEFWDELQMRPAEIGRLHMDGNSLLLNQGDGTFVEAGLERGVWQGGWGWGNRLWDYDNDGDLDVFAANGWFSDEDETDMNIDFITSTMDDPERFKNGDLYSSEFVAGRSWQGHQRNRAFRNDGAGQFTEISWGLGMYSRADSRGVIQLDFDEDGDRDLLVVNTTYVPALTRRSELYRNDVGQDRPWLRVELTGTRSNRLGFGARVEVHTDAGVFTGWMDAGGSYLSSVVQPLHFGLGEATRVERVVVRWPTGESQEIEGPPLRSRIRVTEGGDWEFARVAEPENAG